MPVITASIFSAIIILITVASMMRVFHTGYKRKEIHVKQLMLYALSSVAVGTIITISLPFAYRKLFQWVLGG